MSLHLPNFGSSLHLRKSHPTRLPSILDKSQTSVIKNNKESKEIEYLKQFLIDKYSDKIIFNGKNHNFLVKKAVEDVILNSMSKRKLHKISNSLYEDQKTKQNLLSSNENSAVMKPINTEPFSPKSQIEPEKNEKIIKNEDNKNKKKLLSDIIPGYKYRKEYYDFDEISIDESNTTKSVKSIYRLEGNQDEWSLLIRNDVANYQSQLQKSKEFLRNQQNKLKMELDRQIQAKQEIQQKEKLEDHKYHEIMMKQVNNQEEIEKQQNTKTVQKNINIKEALDKQLESFVKTQNIEKKIEKKTKKAITEQIQNEIREENQKIFLEKQKKLQMNQEMMRESIANRKKVLLEEMKEKEKDVQMQENYAKDFENMLIEREKQKKQRLEEIQKKYGDFSNVLKNFDKNKIDIEDQIQLKYFKDKEEEEKKEDERRKAKIKENKQFIKESLLKQIKEKEQAKENEAQLNKKQAEYWQKNTLEFLEEEQNKKNQEKEKKLIYIEGLKTQTQMKSSLYVPEKKMNKEELLQNKDLLKTFVSKNENEHFIRDFVKLKKKNY